MAKLSIASIQDVQMQTIAKSVDTNNDGILKKEEFNLFAQEATKAGVDYKTISETLGLNGFQRWIHDVDKVCTDGQDDGKLAFGEKMESFGKGLAGLVKGAINKPILTAATVVAGAGLVALTGGAILPVMIAAGVTMGAGMIGVGAYKAAKADTDAEAKQAWETIGTGTFAIGASTLGAKSALNQANKAGVTSAQGAKDLSIGKALVQNFKSIPEAVKVSGMNIKGNVLTLFTKIIHPHSNKLQNAHQFKIKTNDKPQIVNTNEQTTGSFKVVQEGTKIKTLEGIKTVQKGEVVGIDSSGNLYITTPKDIANKAYNLSFEAQRDLFTTLGYKPYNKYTYCLKQGDPWENHYELYYRKPNGELDRFYTTREFCDEYNYYKIANEGLLNKN